MREETDQEASQAGNECLLLRTYTYAIYHTMTTRKLDAVVAKYYLPKATEDAAAGWSYAWMFFLLYYDSDSDNWISNGVWGGWFDDKYMYKLDLNKP